MSEQQFVLDKLYYSIMTPIEKISVGRNYITYGEVVDLLNGQQAIIKDLKEENEQLRKAEKINMEYAEQIVEENHKFSIAKNDLRRENEQLQKENEQLRKQVAEYNMILRQHEFAEEEGFR